MKPKYENLDSHSLPKLKNPASSRSVTFPFGVAVTRSQQTICPEHPKVVHRGKITAQTHKKNVSRQGHSSFVLAVKRKARLSTDCFTLTYFFMHSTVLMFLFIPLCQLPVVCMFNRLCRRFYAPQSLCSIFLCYIICFTLSMPRYFHVSPF